MCRPWAEAGFDCYAVDLQHPQTRNEGRITFVRADITQCVSQWLPVGRPIAFAAGFPPCTHTAVSGARHFIAKGPAGAAQAFTLIARVDQLLRWMQCPYLWEQPVSVTSTYCGKPDHVFDRAISPDTPTIRVGTPIERRPVSGPVGVELAGTQADPTSEGLSAGFVGSAAWRKQHQDEESSQRHPTGIQPGDL